MNLLEHYINNVESVSDVSDAFKASTGYTPKEPLYEVTMAIDCMGIKERVTKQFFETEWNHIKKQGYYLA